MILLDRVSGRSGCHLFPAGGRRPFRPGHPDSEGAIVPSLRLVVVIAAVSAATFLGIQHYQKMRG